MTEQAEKAHRYSRWITEMDGGLPVRAYQEYADNIEGPWLGGPARSYDPCICGHLRHEHSDVGFERCSFVHCECVSFTRRSAHSAGDGRFNLLDCPVPLDLDTDDEPHRTLVPAADDVSDDACEHHSASLAGDIKGTYWVCDGCELEVPLTRREASGGSASPGMLAEAMRHIGYLCDGIGSHPAYDDCDKCQGAVARARAFVKTIPDEAVHTEGDAT